MEQAVEKQETTDIQKSTNQYPSSIDDMQKLGDVLLKSGWLPEHYKTSAQIIAGIIKCRELDLPIHGGLSKMYVVNGRVSMEGELILAMIYRSKELKSISIEGDSHQCTVVMERNNGVKHTLRYTIEMAKMAKLHEKKNSQWVMRPDVMLRWRAIAYCGRLVFPDLILGIMLPDEMEEVLSTIPETLVSENDASYGQCFESLQKIGETKSFTESELIDWYELWKQEVDFLSENKKSTIRRLYQKLQQEAKSREVKPIVGEVVTPITEADVKLFDKSGNLVG